MHVSILSSIKCHLDLLASSHPFFNRAMIYGKLLGSDFNVSLGSTVEVDLPTPLTANDYLWFRRTDRGTKRPFQSPTFIYEYVARYGWRKLQQALGGPPCPVILPGVRVPTQTSRPSR